MGNQNPYIEEEQTTQWPKWQTTIYQDTHKTKYRLTGTPLKNWGTDNTMAKVKSESN